MQLLKFEARYGELAEALLFGAGRRARHLLTGILRKCNCGKRSSTFIHGRECYSAAGDDLVIAKALRITGEFDFNLLRNSLRKIGLEELDLLVDVGANIGTISVPAVRRGLAKRAIAIEGFTSTYEVLLANISANGMSSKIEALNVAVGAAPGLISFEEVVGNPGANSITTDGKNSPTIELTTLDQLLEGADWDTGLVFADIEGYEFDMLLGSEITLKRRIPFVLEFNPALIARYRSKDEVIKVLKSNFNEFGVARSPSGIRHKIDLISELWDYLLETKRATDLVLIPGI